MPDRIGEVRPRRALQLSTLGLFHTGCGVLALVAGGWIFLTTKGTNAHKRVGWIYVASMTSLNVTALRLYNLTGGFNTFHLLAVFSLATLAVGVAQVLGRGRWRKWMWRHYQYMAWSYVGLLAATCNEAFVRLPPLRQIAARTAAPLPLLVMLAIVALSAMVIFAMQARVLARYGGTPRLPSGSSPNALNE